MTDVVLLGAGASVEAGVHASFDMIRRLLRAARVPRATRDLVRRVRLPRTRLVGALA